MDLGLLWPQIKPYFKSIFQIDGFALWERWSLWGHLMKFDSQQWVCRILLCLSVTRCGLKKKCTSCQQLGASHYRSRSSYISDHIRLHRYVQNHPSYLMWEENLCKWKNEIVQTSRPISYFILAAVFPFTLVYILRFSQNKKEMMDSENA